MTPPRKSQSGSTTPTTPTAPKRPRNASARAADALIAGSGIADATVQPSNPERPARPPKPEAKMINLALQGGGAHGAFTWGVLDRLLEDDRLAMESVSATSAGAVNGALLSYGLATGGRDGAKRVLYQFWRRLSDRARFSPLQPTMWDMFMGTRNLNFSPAFFALDSLTRVLAPGQFNIFDINPLRDLLEEMVDFRVIREESPLKLFINATNVRTGKIRVFNTKEIDVSVIRASACLPFLFKTVEIEGEPYWDGGYSGNPAIYPLIYHCGTRDVVIVQINPLTIDEVPSNAPDIFDRINEISFNNTLMREMRAIAFVSRLLEEGTLSDSRYKNMRIHMIEASDIMAGMGRASKLNAEWSFLKYLHETGRQAANDWIETHFDKVGVKSSLDIRATFM